MQLEDINLLDRDRFAHGIPHHWFTFLRENHPFYRHPEPNGPGFWVATKHADVQAITRDTATFSSRIITPLEEYAAPVDYDERKPVIILDPPEHTAYRKLINPAFSPRRVNALEDHIREIAARTIDEAIAKGECDFVTDVAAAYPVEVIAELIGMPAEDRQKIIHWTHQLLGGADAGQVDPEYFTSPDQLQRAHAEMFLYTQDLCRQRREEPRDDIMTELVGAELDGRGLSDQELAGFFFFLILAGNETTRYSSSYGLNAFLDFPDEWDKFVQDPHGLSPVAVEEILRWATPVTYLRRDVTTPTEVRGHELKPGDKVGLWYISANRDEEVFEDPFRFDIERKPNRHVAFGGNGPHFCAGAPLARLELRVLFEELAERVPVLEATGDPAYLRSNGTAGIKHLPVRLRSGAVVAG